MAITPDQLAAAHRPQAPRGPAQEGPQAPPAPQREVTFYKSDLLNIQGPEITTDAQRRPEGTLEGEPVTFHEPLIKQYENFLYNYVQQLYQLNRREPNILRGPNHVYDRQLLRELVNERGVPQRDKIWPFLRETPQNWENTTVAMENLAPGLIFSLGLKAYLNPPGGKVVWASEDTIHTGIDQGALNHLWNNSLGPFLTQLTNVADARGARLGEQPGAPRWLAALQTAGFSAGLGLGGLIEGVFRTGNVSPIDAAVGASIPITLGGILHLTRTGVTIDVRRLPAVFQSIKNDPNEIKFMSAMTGINLDNYDVVGGQLQLLTPAIHGVAAVHEIEKSPEQILDEALKILYTRQEFFTTLGIPYRTLDEMPEQFLFLPSPQFEQVAAMEQTAFRVHGDVYREFMRPVLGGPGGLRDIWGQTPDDPAFGRYNGFFGPPVGPIPDYDVNNLDIAGNIQRWREARARILTGRSTREINEARQENERGGLISNLDNTLSNFDEFKRKRADEIEKRRAPLEGDKTTIGNQKTQAEQYRTSLATYQEAVEMARINAQTGLNETLASLIDPTTGAAFPNAVAALAALNAVLVTPGTSITIDANPITCISERAINAEAALNAPLPVGASAQALVMERESRTAAFNREMERINEDKAKVKAAIDRLLAATRTPTTPLPENLDQTNEQVLAVTGSLRRLQTEFDAIAGPANGIDARLAAAGLAAVGLTENDLRTQSIDVLLKRINDANTAGAGLVAPLDIGWPEAQNAIPQVRARLIHAMTEARARVSVAVAAPGLSFTQLTENWEITEHQLQTLTAEQINQMLVARQAANPMRYAGLPVFALLAIENMKALARERLTARAQAMAQMETFLQTHEAAARQAKEAIDLTESRERYEMVKSLLENRLAIYENAKVMAADVGRFFNDTLVDPANTALFTAAERATYTFTPTFPAGAAPIVRQHSLGYVELMDVLFKYRQKSGEDRSKAFQQVVQILPPDRLAMLLDQTIGPLVGLAPAFVRNDINNVFADLQFLRGNGTISDIEIQEILDRIINQVAEETRVRGVV